MEAIDIKHTREFLAGDTVGLSEVQIWRGRSVEGMYPD
jgi:hypothetical protein